jgi:hypothetical protein
MMKRNYILMFAMCALLIVVALFSVTAPVRAQTTATPTATSAATSTPTPTATPVSTALPMLNSVSSYVNSQRCGAYSLSVTGSDCFQAQDGGGYSAYSTAGQLVWHVDGSGSSSSVIGVLGDATANQYIQRGSVSVTGSATFTPIAGATVVGNPQVSLGTVNGDAELVSGSYLSGTISIAVTHVISNTPVANATPATVEYWYIYNK